MNVAETRVTIKDVAKEANVSISTVSRVVNNPNIVASDKKQRVQAVIDKLGYVPNAAAREMVMKSTRMIGVLVSDAENPYISTVLAVFCRELERYNYGVFISITDMNVKKEKHYIELMLQRHVEALVMLGIRPISPKFYAWVARRLGDVPLIKVGPGFDKCYYNIYTDEWQGAYLAVEHLIRLGHKRIGIVNGELNYDSYYCKQSGFLAALKENGLEIDESVICHIAAVYNSESTGRIVRLLEQKNRPTAVVTHGDLPAMIVYNAAKQLGLKIPTDLSVVGYGNSNFSKLLTPELTTIDQMTTDLGAHTARLVMAILTDEKPQRETVFGVNLIQRNSTSTVG